MTTNDDRPVKFLRIARLWGGKLESTISVHIRYVQHVQPADLPSQKLYDVYFEDCHGLPGHGFAIAKDLRACGIPLPDCLGYQMELDPKRFGIVSEDQ